MKENLKEVNHPFNFQLISAENIPYSDATFDGVIANGLLYLVSDLEKTIKEIARVIKFGGMLIASTSGSKYMKEVEDLIIKTDLPIHRNYTKHSFSLDNGKESLSQNFSRVEVFRKGDSLLVTEAEPLAEHILSTNENLSEEQVKQVRVFFDEYFKKNKQLKFTIDTGLCIGKK
ncbi:class I SAM-dependent methyltransferase [Patescibacteria group bacterium]|nr:class I SAM-dependent methyltransferase [Patescibacteria group bacterium]